MYLLAYAHQILDPERKAPQPRTETEAFPSIPRSLLNKARPRASILI